MITGMEMSITEFLSRWFHHHPWDQLREAARQSRREIRRQRYRLVIEEIFGEEMSPSEWDEFMASHKAL